MDADVQLALADAIAIAEAANLKVMLVGAWARDLCLPEPQRGMARKTRDADLSISCSQWHEIDAYFESASQHFECNPDELFMRHRTNGTKVDLVPFGSLEQPPGTLRLRRTSRTLSTVGIREAMLSGVSHQVIGRSHVVPLPGFFVMLKMVSYWERRAPRDLRDAGYVLRRYQVDADDIFDDNDLMEHLASGRLGFEDVSVWMLGRQVTQNAGRTVVEAMAANVRDLTEASAPVRLLLAGWTQDASEALAWSDSTLQTLQLVLNASREPTPAPRYSRD